MYAINRAKKLPTLYFFLSFSVVLKADDKGEVNIYFVHNENCKKYSRDNKPTVIIIPGITGWA